MNAYDETCRVEEKAVFHTLSLWICSYYTICQTDIRFILPIHNDFHAVPVHSANPETLAGGVQVALGISLVDCYQCGKCTAGCPVADRMDLPPGRMIRLLQYEMPVLDERVLASQGLWVCMACGICSERCPQELDVLELIAFLRREAVQKDRVHPKGRRILAFHRSVLSSVEQSGRLHGLGALAIYKLRTLRFVEGAGLLFRLILKGKLFLLPSQVGDVEGLKRVFRRTTR